MKGSGNFTIGSGVWPGASKLLEEMGEPQQALGKLQQTLGKLIQTSGTAEHWELDCECGGKLHRQTLASENGGTLNVMICDKCGR